MVKMRAILCGYYGKGNGGDEALLASLLQMLPSEVTPYVLSGNPAQTKMRYGVESGDRFSLFTLLQALGRGDLFIWGGGSLMQDVTSWASPLYYSGLMALAQQRGLKTIAWAQGIGPLKRTFIRGITRRVLQNCTGVSVRDRASAKLMSNWGISCLIAPDPVWALEATSVKGIWDTSAPRVAVTLRPHYQLTPQRLQCLTQALISFQAATQTTILLIPFQPIQDLPIAQTIQAQLPASQIISLEDPRQLKGLFSAVEMVIGMRFHSLIMAASQGCRCFALSYDPKVSQLMSAVNLPGWELNQLPESASLISQTWLEEYVNGNSLSKEQIQSLVDRALIHREILLNCL